jgi:RNA polymerase sigma factor (sigma-70 family)
MKLHQRMNINGNRIENTNAWLYKVAGNLCLNSIKSTLRQGPKIDLKNTDFIDFRNPEENLIAQEKSERVRYAIDQISPKHRRLIFMYQDGLSYKEMSNATGIPFTSIGKTLWRCIDKISTTLKNSENE